MKKQYQKPMMYFESFQLSQSIATGCASDAKFAEDQCAVFIPDIGATIFGDAHASNSQCEWSPEGFADRVCYHIPTAGDNVFGS